MKLVINEKEYEIKSEYSIEQFMKLLAFDINIEFNWDKVISIAYQIPIDEVSIMPDKTKEVAISFVGAFLNNIDSNHINPNIKKLDELTFGEFIDMDVYIADGLHKSLDKIMKLLYGIESSEIINEYYGGFLYYLKWRQSIFNKYKNLFNNNNDETDEEEVESVQLNSTQVARSWYKTVAYLSDDDLLKMDEILKKPLYGVLNFMAYKKEKNLNELQRINKQNQKRTR